MDFGEFGFGEAVVDLGEFSFGEAVVGFSVFGEAFSLVYVFGFNFLGLGSLRSGVTGSIFSEIIIITIS